uniref:Cytochrome b-c1 complex subunit 8 n=1 Tax=Ditylenchus dipsaci TaxID=166011 RepID=A0A915DE00_9BILA
MPARKMASAAIVNREKTPLIAWIRNRLSGYYRDTTRPHPPGFLAPTKEPIYHNHARYPHTQSARSPDPPVVPGGIHHLLADNYYCERDGRRTVKPPQPIDAGKEVRLEIAAPPGSNSQHRSESRQTSPGILKGPEENFGLPEAPTPGLGYSWSRNLQEEMHTQKVAKSYAMLEKLIVQCINRKQKKMRVSAVAQSGKFFGHLNKVYGEYRFALSPKEQKPFKGFFENSIVKVINSYVIQNWYNYLPPATIAYLGYRWGLAENARLSRKDPKEFENDV